MPVLCNKEVCYGCTACVQVCPNHAIWMQQDEEGFLYPKIDESLCVQCGKCEQACSRMQAQIHAAAYPQKALACQVVGNDIRQNSTSGGVFFLLACTVMGKGGSVFGAACNADMEVEHIQATNVRELMKTQGSKYVQSKLGDTFAQVKNALSSGKPVLFSGTPCQVSGLMVYLNKSYDNLITCDLVCHGVPSPTVWRSYVLWQEERHGGKCTQVNFRSKRLGWHCYSMEMKFQNGKAYQETTYADPFSRGFLRNFFLRPSCYHCAFARTERVSDITLADYWGYDEKEGVVKHDEKGISLVIINTEQGRKVFDQIQKQMLCEERPIEDARQKNPSLRGPSAVPDNRAGFWNDYRMRPFQTVIDRYLYPDPDATKKRIQWSLPGRWLFMFRKRLKRLLLGAGIRSAPRHRAP